MPQEHGCIKAQIFCILIGLLSAINCYAQAISSTELINNAKQYDTKTVIFEGEVIGDVMERGEYAWVNVNDGDNAIGVWMSKDLSKTIIYTGSFKSKGDVVEVTGTFHRSCLVHGGDLDIHAQGMRRINSGRALAEKINTGKRNLVFILAGALCLALALNLLNQLLTRKSGK